MSKKGVEQKPSETALFAALYRAIIASKEFNNEGVGSDDLAKYFLPSFLRFLIQFNFIRENIKNNSNKLTPGIYEYVRARTAFFDNIFVEALNKKIPQIVVLGAGYDTRAYRFALLNDSTKIFELDITPTQNRKRQCLQKAKIDFTKHTTLVPIDFNKQSLKTALEKADYDNNEKTLFIWEGVNYYLDPGAVDVTLEFVKNTVNHESFIALDYAISISEENINDYYGARKFIEFWKKRRSGEPFKFTIDEGAIESFLEQRGLKIVNHLDNEQIEKMFLHTEHESSLGRITGFFRFVIASPNNNLQTNKS